MGIGVQNASAGFTVLPDNTTHVRTVSGSATADLPLTLISIIVPSGTTSISVSATAQRRDVNVILVLDHSGPMGGPPLTQLQTDATAFVTSFANNRDNMGLVAFAAGAYLAQAPTQKFASAISTEINTMQPLRFSSPNTAGAIWTAYQQLVALNQPGALNVIVLFTGGVPSAFAGNFAGFLIPGSDPTISLYGGCGMATSPLNGLLLTTLPRYTAGLAGFIPQSINDTPETSPAPGCTSLTSPDYFLTQMPATDVNGNSINGTSAYQAGVTLTSFNPNNIQNAAENAFDDAANKIRSDTNLAPIIYAIGLNLGNGSAPDPILMARIANDPGSAYYNSSQPAGLYLAAPDPAHLATAFANIAAQVLQLARN
jgi:hypothetical protein